MKSPAFQLYAADFYMDTASWTATEVGAYFRLLLHEWVSGPLPNDMGKLSRIAGVDPRTMGKMWKQMTGKFLVSDDGTLLQNSRLENTRKEQEEYRERQVESGRLGGLHTQERHRKESSNPSSNPSSENKALHLQSSTSKNDIDIIPPTPLISAPKKNPKMEIPPAIELVAEYCLYRKNGINPQTWWDSYAAKGWMIGKNRMVDWKACVRTWEQNSGGNGNGAGNTGRAREIIKKAGRASSDGQPYPIDAEC